MDLASEINPGPVPGFCFRRLRPGIGKTTRRHPCLLLLSYGAVIGCAAESCLGRGTTVVDLANPSYT